jgi:manganese transport protein
MRIFMKDIKCSDSHPLPWYHNRPSNHALGKAYRSIAVVPPGGSPWRKFLAFLGPGYLVAVGYMDPGNWATSLAGGSRFGYALLSVALLSNLMAIVLQSLCARLAVATGRNLAQACRDAYPSWVAYPLWILAEIAICATDLAEVIGTAIGLKLLFGIPLEIGIVITALDVFLILWLQNRGFRYLEAFVIALLLVTAGCFCVQIFLANPVWGEVFTGMVMPTSQLLHDSEMLYLAMGILGATVMPHNLYLHSSIVQTRAYGSSLQDKTEAVHYATLDSTIALIFAFAINASILILAAATFYPQGYMVEDIEHAHTLLQPLLGSVLAPTLFALALVCCGLNSTVTATMAGQIVMEGFLHIQLRPWLRRLLTRGLAIIPALIVALYYGEQGTAKLLILSQVILSFQLPFAMIPLIAFTTSRRKMGDLVAPLWLGIIGSIIALTVTLLVVKLALDVL